MADILGKKEKIIPEIKKGINRKFDAELYIIYVRRQS